MTLRCYYHANRTRPCSGEESKYSLSKDKIIFELVKFGRRQYGHGRQWLALWESFLYGDENDPEESVSDSFVEQGLEFYSTDLAMNLST